MHRQRGDHDRQDKQFSYRQVDGEVTRGRHGRKNAGHAHARHRPHDVYSRNKRFDWFEDIDED